ncbi:VanZ family protein [Arthrobacter sp. MI7-26]|uniref:VanZ family protein n=1 Tax=Arthrobacter sp. MI7-26 TaxID=2993653 RepID=UPI002248AEF8|nr:VanZ family protein [Arthrobacter sp. MI7-26]MCX2747056.1 VanZ family protein [Arthrobacter sp. MI7-26]
MAHHISSSSGRGFFRCCDFRLDAPLVKWRSTLKPVARPRLHRWVLLGYLMILANIAFWPSPVDKPVASDLAALLDFLHRHGIPEWLNYGFVEASANVLLFAPAGLLLALTLPRKRWWQLLALGAAMSGTVELGQLLFLPHRFSSWQDILMNTLGVGIGLLFATLLKRVQLRRPALGEP